MDKKFREEVVEYLVQCQNQKPFGKWAFDSSGTAMPLDIAEFGAKYMLDKVCEWLRENWRQYVWTDGDGIVHFGHWEKDLRKHMFEKEK